MNGFTGQLADIQTVLEGILDACRQADDAASPPADTVTDLPTLEQAFAQLLEDATRFFSEGMQQMEALNYPPHVRKVMEKYHREWPVNRSLH